jgi:hypothetical protein
MKCVNCENTEVRQVSGLDGEPAWVCSECLPYGMTASEMMEVGASVVAGLHAGFNKEARENRQKRSDAFWRKVLDDAYKACIAKTEDGL